MTAIRKKAAAKTASAEKLWLFLILICGILFICSSCGKKEKGTAFQIYYLNMNETCILPQTCYIESDTMSQQDLADKLISELMSEPDDSKLRRTIPASIACRSVTLSQYDAVVDMPGTFYDESVVSNTEDVLIRAAIVKTLTQIPDIVYVSFTVDGSPMVGRDGKTLRKMGADDFVENPEDAINNVQETTLKLYFADETGTCLKPVERTVSYSSNTSMERLVMKQLISGVTLSGYKSTVPADTRIISISVMDGVCYVNLDETFRTNQTTEISEAVILYSIVDSLSELDDIDQVQISINGDTSGMLLYNYPLSAMYEADYELVSLEEGTESVIRETEIEE